MYLDSKVLLSYNLTKNIMWLGQQNSFEQNVNQGVDQAKKNLADRVKQYKVDNLNYMANDIEGSLTSESEMEIEDPKAPTEIESNSNTMPEDSKPYLEIVNDEIPEEPMPKPMLDWYAIPDDPEPEALNSDTTLKDLRR